MGLTGRKKAGDRVVSVRLNKTNGQYRTRYVEDGKNREEHYPSKPEAMARAQDLRQRFATQAQLAKAQQPAPQPGQGVKLGDGHTAEDWINLLWWLALRATKTPKDEDLRRLIRSVATAATEARQQIKSIAEGDEAQDEIAALSDEELRQQIKLLAGGKK